MSGNGQSIGVIGAGPIAEAITVLAGRVGQKVALSNSRGPESLQGLVGRLGEHVSAVTAAEAAEREVVILAVPWRSVGAAVAPLSPWSGRLLVDSTNSLQAPDFIPADLGGRTSSQVVESLVPGARLVKTLNTLLPHQLAADPREGGGRRVQFVSGDDAAARQAVTGLLESWGFAVVDLGELAVGSSLQQFPGGVLPTLNLLRL
jgi:predicted dinucleotide-binding enzyme